MMPVQDDLPDLEALGITVAWAAHMQHAALWLPEDTVMVLNASTDRQRLSECVSELLWSTDDEQSHH